MGCPLPQSNTLQNPPLYINIPYKIINIKLNFQNNENLKQILYFVTELVDN